MICSAYFEKYLINGKVDTPCIGEVLFFSGPSNRVVYVKFDLHNTIYF